MANKNKTRFTVKSSEMCSLCDPFCYIESFQVVDGYFTHFFAPVGLTPLKKRILFVLDVSGSMSFGGKLDQMKVSTGLVSLIDCNLYFDC